MPSVRVRWPDLLAIAKQLALAETAQVGVAPTLRRLHYLLVSNEQARDLGYANTVAAYKTLSDRTARARENGQFPDLTDRQRSIARARGWDNLSDYLYDLVDWFELDRQKALAVDLVVVAEKDGIVPLIQRNFGWLDVTATKGYASVTHADSLIGRYSDAVYVGDFDPSGVDIDRDLSDRTGLRVHRVALSRAQIDEFALPPMMAKTTDSRLAAMQAAYGEVMQVEIDALPPAELLRLIGQKVSELGEVDLDDNYRPINPDLDAQEQAIRAELERLAGEAA